MAIILTLGFLCLLVGVSYWQHRDNVSPSYTVVEQQIIPVVFYDTSLDSNEDYEVARSVYEYLFFGLNSSQDILGYRFSQLSQRAREQLQREGLALKSWVKQSGAGYQLNVSVWDNVREDSFIEFEQYFTEENFIDAIGDTVLEIKAYIAPGADDINTRTHRITSVSEYHEWQIIAKAISFFYQGKGIEDLQGMERELNELREQGSTSYLLDSLGSYIQSMRYLGGSDRETKENALVLADKAFEKNPRCNISNATLGLALLLNDRSEQAHPHLFYAAENAPSAMNYYLLSMADRESNNPRGAEYYYQLYSQLNKSDSRLLYSLNEYLQKANP